MQLDLRSFKFRLYPNKDQEKRFANVLEVNRIIYNYFVLNSFRSRNDMNYALTELKEQQPILCNYHSKMLQMVSTKVEGAWKALAKLKKRGHQSGKGKLLLLKQCNSFTYNQTGYSIDGNKLYLSKIGRIRIVLHRQPINVKQVTVCRQNGRWYAVVACENSKPIFKFIDPRRSVGIDVGITKFAHDSDNYATENPLFLTNMLKPLRRAQRRVSRRKKGSHNREKAKSWIARLHERIANKRLNFLHKVSTRYATRYDLIFLERLRTRNMVKNHRLARRILDSGWGTFTKMLQYKSKMVMEVEPHNTSVNCSGCGNPVPKTLMMRTHRCEMCCLVIDRDYNASLNILQRGLALLNLPVGRREVTPVEIAPLLVNGDGHARSMKQEASSLCVGSSRTKCSFSMSV